MVPQTQQVLRQRLKLAFELSRNDFSQKVAARVAYAGAIDNDMHEDAAK